MPKSTDPFVDLRNEVDQINKDLSSLLERRFKILDKIFEIKKARKIPPFDFVRHQEMLDQIKDNCSLTVEPYVTPIMEEVFHQGAQYLAHTFKKESE
ncbi:MAG: chorismate mutase [Bdellovibrionales bacterium]|nr:chorismate mutase [Bdellovibrionales bacterium]